jgi:hypothetical protein
MRHAKAKKWEMRLKTVFDRIDRELEKQYSGRFKLHPSRPALDSTSNPEMDGLFNVGASYSAGFGSKFGPGYVVEIRLSTLQHVPQELRDETRERVHSMLNEQLPLAFPGVELRVDQDGEVLKIHGDLSLDF